MTVSVAVTEQAGAIRKQFKALVPDRLLGSAAQTALSVDSSAAQNNRILGEEILPLQEAGLLNPAMFLVAQQAREESDGRAAKVRRILLEGQRLATGTENLKSLLPANPSNIPLGHQANTDADNAMSIDSLLNQQIQHVVHSGLAAETCLVSEQQTELLVSQCLDDIIEQVENNWVAAAADSPRDRHNHLWQTCNKKMRYK